METPEDVERRMIKGRPDWDTDMQWFEDGPWQSEPHRVEWRDAATGYPCLIVRGGVGALCGYVAVPPGHPYHGVGCDGVPVEVHGGLTYSSLCQHHICHIPKPGEPSDVWWLGFDCAHAFDVLPFPRDSGSRSWRSRACEGWAYRDINYVRKEVTALAAQLFSAAVKESPPRLNDAMELLQSALAMGPATAAEIERRAASENISPQTLARARAALGINDRGGIYNHE